MTREVLSIEREGAVAILAMNRPEVKNALDEPLLHALGEALEREGASATTRAVVLTGSGGSFCSGVDLKQAIAAGPPDRLEERMAPFHRLIRAIASAPKPVVAMVDGPAVGFGCDLALACDLRVASSEAYFQEKFVKIGLMPDGGGTYWLPRLVGLGRAMELMLLGEAVRAPEALAMGLVNRVVPKGSLFEAALGLARRLAEGPPLAFAAIKQAARAGLHGTLETALEAEKAGQIRCLTSSDCMEGVLAWMQKREPKFTGA